MKTITGKTVFDTIIKSAEKYTREQLAITRIPAPTFEEKKRGEYMLKKFRAIGLKKVQRDKAGNILGLVKGGGSAKALAVSAHLDTVFGPEVPIKVYKKGNTLFGPGISDNSTGLVGLVALAEAMVRVNKKPDRDIWFIANVCEEGNGDLIGMRYLFHKSGLKSKIGEFIAIDGDGLDRVVTNGVGSVRYKVTVTGPGGHSFGAFGLVNPINVLSDFIARFKTYKVPARYKTTFNVGVVSGGTSVNTIPAQVTAEVDMRSVNRTALTKLERYFLASLKTAEKANRVPYGKSFDIKAVKIGERPVGHTPEKAGLVQAVKKVWKAWGYEPQFNWSSTDANIPMSLNIPAICAKLGGISSGGHTVREKYDVTGREKGICLVLDLILHRTGIELG